MYPKNGLLADWLVLRGWVGDSPREKSRGRTLITICRTSDFVFLLGFGNRFAPFKGLFLSSQRSLNFKKGVRQAMLLFGQIMSFCFP